MGLLTWKLLQCPLLYANLAYASFKSIEFDFESDEAASRNAETFNLPWISLVLLKKNVIKIGLKLKWIKLFQSILFFLIFTCIVVEAIFCK